MCSQKQMESKSIQKRASVVSTLLSIVKIGRGKNFEGAETGVDTGADTGGHTIWNTYSRRFSHLQQIEPDFLKAIWLLVL